MILDVEKFIRKRRSEWDEFEAMVVLLESDARAKLDLDEAQRFHYLYERVAADLSKLSAYAVEPRTKRYLESLVARGFGEMHGCARGLPFATALAALLCAFPAAVRRHARVLALVVAIFSVGAIFGGAALALDPSSKSVLMPFSHLQGDPSERVAEEEVMKGTHMDGGKSNFSAQLMTHNTKVAILTLALGMTFGIGTSIFLFYNGVILGAVIVDYILAGETVFLTGWLLPHGSVEIPAILLAGQGGLLLGRTLLFAQGRMSLGERLRSIRGDLVLIISGVAVMLIWAGLIESFFSQYHEPVLPYALKIGFGVLQLIGVCAYFMFMGRKEEGAVI
ncbi:MULTISPECIES: stage II sporulation protein M [unclassified Lentimonas]|uniref:stage II sporulation protein M n=1 Tax=unclassified Lentimonas TaxID=2630993 RepID=UPI001324E3A6|nr:MULTISPECIES: stage II sporulation protein M [unclassified Lentimonas]CAA6694104.1 FIG00838073: hypothetical protein [Lentimonas sp. CC19]CAA6694397.1 FIG00838073: hypothetical protein [Lentimonas sp. CC10]CAA7070337.1 FIG00838073: hypothetical protein [Lentimonas sp. CC11]